jgi:hypothetical protein
VNSSRLVSYTATAQIYNGEKSIRECLASKRNKGKGELEYKIPGLREKSPEHLGGFKASEHHDSHQITDGQ